MNARRWLSESATFLLWAVAGTAALVTVLGMLTIGIFVLPVAAALVAAGCILTFNRPHREFTVVGALLGPAALSSYIGTWAADETTPDGLQSHLELSRFLPFLAVTAGCTIAALALFITLGVRAHRLHPVTS